MAEPPTTGVSLQWVTLPLLELIHVSAGFWVCKVCAATGVPGSYGNRRAWSSEAVDVALAAGIEHLRVRHYLRQVVRESVGDG